VALVLEHAADALTIGRLLSDDPVGPELEAQGQLLEDLLRSSTLDEQALRARARALGLPAGGVLTAMVLRVDGDADGSHERDRGDPVEIVAAAADGAGAGPSSGTWRRDGSEWCCRAGPAPARRRSSSGSRRCCPRQRG
jgi:hypothetical protein